MNDADGQRLPSPLIFAEIRESSRLMCWICRSQAGALINCESVVGEIIKQCISGRSWNAESL